MNRLKLLLALSVALNAGLITLLLLHTASNPDYRRSSLSAPASSISSTTTVSLEQTETADGEAAPATVRGYRRLLAALRASGLPEPEIHRILRGTALADWQEDLHRMRQENRSRTDEFWKGGNSRLGRDLENQRRAIELRRAREAALAELIDDEQPLSPWLLYPGEPRWGIPAEKRRAVLMLEEDYELLAAEIRLRGGNPEALRLLDQERREDLAQILLPEELEEYELRHSETADALRHDLRFFDATEDEFRSLFRLRQALETDFPLRTAAPEQRQAAEEALKVELRNLIGEERFAAYEHTQDFRFQQLVELTARLGLSTDKAHEIYDFKTLAEEQREELYNDPDLTPDDRDEAARLLAEEAREVVREALGEQGYQAYLQESGRWIHDLEPEADDGEPAL